MWANAQRDGRPAEYRVNFASGKIPLRGNSRRKCIYV